VKKDEACEQHREWTAAALPLVVIRPVRPVLIWRAVVRRVAAARKQSDQEENGADDA
jgi:hypothetical protein